RQPLNRPAPCGPSRFLRGCGPACGDAMTHPRDLDARAASQSAGVAGAGPLPAQARLAAPGRRSVHHPHWREIAPARRPFRIRAVDRGMCRLVTPRRADDAEATTIEGFDSFGADYILADAMPPKVDPVAVGDWVVLDDEG